MNDILTRLEAASGPDRILDGEIWKAISTDGAAVWMRDGRGMWMRQDPGDRVAFDLPPAYTGSLDAQKSLTHPDWQVSSGNCGEDNGPWACVTTPDNVDHTPGEEGAATEELARLIALLKAIQHVAATPAMTAQDKG